MRFSIIALSAALALAPAASHAATLLASSLADMTLEQLADIQVTSVSKRPQPVSSAAASVFVITNDDIRRSGATTLPEALRLAPNLQVAQVDASQYAITARGFNNAIGNKLLVLIDGRTVYSPLFSGVFWDQQDVMLEDVERIEVISGPGGTLWGANAVNGVINIITRPALDTQGALVSGGVGKLGQGADFRYGGKLDGGGAFRVYGKSSRLENTASASGASVADGIDRTQTGFRIDGGERSGAYTLQGDAYNGKAEPRPGGLPSIEFSGLNLLGRWTAKHADGSESRLQAYFDHTERDDRLLFSPRADILDVEYQRSSRGAAHALVWGGGYRYAHDDIGPGLFFAFVPPSRRLHWANLFAQDEISLASSVKLTAGVKVEHNDYTGLETLPSVRLAWQPGADHLLWGAVSRAVRAPARLDHDIRLPGGGPPFFIVGGSDFVSEVANVFELGYRGQLERRLNFSATAFRYEWDRLRSGQLPPAMVQNRIEGSTYGLELWGTLQATKAWRLSAGLTTLTERLHVEEGSTDPTGPSALANDPHYQWQLRSSFDLTTDQDLDVSLRRVGRLPEPVVPAYYSLDARYAWRPRKNLELSATAQNLLDPGHPEFNALPGRSEIERAIFLRATWRL